MLLKREWIQFYGIRNIIHVTEVIFEHIETFCNTVRIHGSCTYMSPAMHERHYKLEKIRKIDID